MFKRRQMASSVKLSALGFTTLFCYIMLCGYICAAEEAFDMPEEVSCTYETQLRHVVGAFECVSDRRQITYLSELLCQRYLVLVFSVVMPEDIAEFKQLKDHTIALGELTARLNRSSFKALEIFDDCIENWGECSYHMLLPMLAQRMGLFEQINDIVKEFERFTLEDVPFIFSLSEQEENRSEGRCILEQKAKQWHRALQELKRASWHCFDLEIPLNLSKQCADALLVYSTAAHINLGASASKRFQGIERRISRFKDKVDEALRVGRSYGTVFEYAQFKEKCAQAFFQSVRSAQLYRFFHTYLCKKIGAEPKPIFMLHHLAVLANVYQPTDSRKLLWKALKQAAVLGDHFSYYATLLPAWQEYCNKRVGALDVLIQKLRSQRASGADEIKQQQVTQLLSRAHEQRERLADSDASNQFLLESFLARPTYIKISHDANRCRSKLVSYLSFMKQETGLQTVQELLGRQEDIRRQTFFDGSEVVADFCSQGHRTTLAKYVSLFFEYYFGKTPWMIKEAQRKALKIIALHYLENREQSELLSHLSMQRLVLVDSDWVEPCYDTTVLEGIRALLQKITREHCQQKQREVSQENFVPPVEDESVQESLSSPPTASSLFGKKMGWQELLSRLEEIERLYIPRVSIREWSKDAGYAHAWRSQKSSLCVTYFFFKEPRQQKERKRNISLNTSTLSKQTDRQGTEWDFYHAFPIELDHTLLNEYCVRIDQNHYLWSQLGLKRGVRNSYAYVVRAKIVPGYTDPIRLQDPDFKDNDFGHTGYFVWICRGKDVCYHRQFHPSSSLRSSSFGRQAPEAR